MSGRGARQRRRSRRDIYRGPRRFVIETIDAEAIDVKREKLNCGHIQAAIPRTGGQGELWRHCTQCKCVSQDEPQLFYLFMWW